MKILMLLSRCDQTGMTTNSLDLCEGLLDLGHTVSLVVGNSPQDDAVAKKRLDDFKALGVKLYIFCGIDGFFSRLIAVSQILFYLITLKYDVIHVESPYLTFCPWLISKKFTSTFHVNDLQKCFYYKNANHLIAISKETKQYAIENMGFAEDEITIVNHGVRKRFAELADNDLKRTIKDKYKIPHDKLIIGLVGSIEKRKGHHILLSALMRCPEDDRKKIHVVFCGSSKTGTENRDWLYNIIDSTLGWNCVTHIEYTESKEIYDILDLTVLPSSLEGFLLVSIESMMSGVCVIRSASEGASEQIIDGETGRLFDVNDIDELSNILHELINNDEERKVLAENGRHYALSHFSAKIMAENTIKVYKKIIKND